MLFRQPRVPEVQTRRGAEVAAEVASRDVEREVVAELHPADVLVHERLDPLHERLALLDVALLAELDEQLLLLLETPRAPPGAPQRDVVRGIRGERESGGRDVPQLGLRCAAVD